MKVYFKLFSIALLLAVLGLSEAFAATAPNMQARYLTFSSLTTTSARVAWINGNGAKRLVVATTNSAINWNDVAADLNTTDEYADNNGNWDGAPQVGTTGAYVLDVLSGSARVASLSNLSANTNYYIHVFEYNIGGVPYIAYNVNAGVNNPRNLGTNMLAPNDLTAGSVTHNSAILGWTDPNATAAASYQIQLSTVANFSAFTVYSVASAPFSLAGLTHETVYFFRVKGIDGAKQSDFSASFSFETGSVPPVITADGAVNFCDLSGVNLEYTDNGLTYEWYRDNVALGHANNPFYVTDAATYKLAGTNAQSVTTFSNEITTTVKPLPLEPTAPGAGMNTFVYDGNFHVPTANPPVGAGIVWYDEAIDGMMIAAPQYKFPGTYTLYAASIEDGCESAARTAITVIVEQKELTLDVTAGSRVYDATTDATGTISIAAGIVLGDAVTVTADFAFGNKNVGNPKTVYVTNITLGGAQAAYYTFATPANPTAEITPKALTFTVAANNRDYNATTNATGSITLTNVITGDVVTADGTFTFDDANVANDIDVDVTGITLDGADKDNYTIAATAATQANITKKEISFTLTANDREYDATTDATGTITLVGVEAVDVADVTVSGTFTFENNWADGIPKTVNVTGITLAGAQAGNYMLDTDNGTTTATINKKSLTLNATADDKPYDATPDATGTITIDPAGIVGAEDVTVSAVFTFENKNVGIGKEVLLSDITLAGTHKDNYTFATPANPTAEITPKALTFTVAADDRPYDATTDGDGEITLAGVISGDVVTAGGTFTFVDANVANDIVVNVTAITLAGADKDNYFIATNTGATNADITKKEISFTVTANNKVYNNSLNATGTITLVGVEAGDVVTVGGDFAFEDKNVGDDKLVNVTNILLGGAQAGNYMLDATSGTANADITKMPINVVANPQTIVYGSADPAFTYTNDALLGGDMLTGLLARAAGQDVGTYAINIGTLVATDNYEINFTGDDLTITKKDLTITADDKNKCEGEVNPELTVQYSGFAYDDDATVVTGLTITTTALQASPAGVYPIELAGGAADNYTLILVDGDLTVSAAVNFATQPTNQAGHTGDDVTFTAVVDHAISYQWLQSTDGVTWQNVPTLGTTGSTTASLTVHSVTTLLNGTQYKLYAENSCGNAESNVVILTVYPAPPAQATGILFNFWSRTEINLSWTRGDGDGCIVVIKEGAGTPDNPTLGQTYNANTVYGMGDETAAGSYVIYNGTGTNVAVTGLTKDKQYTFKVFEYKGSGLSTIYNVTDAANNPRTRKTLIKDSYGDEFTINDAGFTVDKVSPNPAREAVSVNLFTEKQGRFTVELFSMTGERVISTSFELTSGENILYIPISGNIAAGSYSLRISDGFSVSGKQIVVMP